MSDTGSQMVDEVLYALREQIYQLQCQRDWPTLLEGIAAYTPEARDTLVSPIWPGVHNQNASFAYSLFTYRGKPVWKLWPVFKVQLWASMILEHIWTGRTDHRNNLVVTQQVNPCRELDIQGKPVDFHRLYDLNRPNSLPEFLSDVERHLTASPF